MDEYRDEIYLKLYPTDSVQAKRDGCNIFEDLIALNVMMEKKMYYFLPVVNSNFITGKNLF